MEHKGLGVYLDSFEVGKLSIIGKYKAKESIGVLFSDKGVLNRVTINASYNNKEPLPPLQLVDFEDILSMYSKDFIDLGYRLGS